MSAPWKWLIIVAAMIPQMLVWGITITALPLWTVSWLKTFAASHAEVAATSMGLLLGIGCLSPLGGYIVEKFSVRNLIAAGLILASLTYFVLTRTTAMWQIIVLHTIPLAAALMLTGPLMGQVIAVKLFAPKPELAIGVVTMGAPAGGIIMPYVIGKMLEIYTWQTAYLIFIVAALALVPLVFFAIPKFARSDDAVQGQARTPAAEHLPMTNILMDRVFIGSAAIAMMLNVLFNAVFYNLGSYLQEIGVNASGTAGILSITSLLSLAGTFVFAALAERIDYRLILLMSVLFVSSGVAAAATGTGMNGLMIILPLMAISVGGNVSLMSVIMAQRFGQANFARATGLIMPFVFMGAVGPYIAGYGRDVLGSYPKTFLVMLTLVIIPVLALLLLATVKRTKPEEAMAS
jgi:MFS family permease